MIVIVNEQAIREKAKRQERARIVTELALEGTKLRGSERKGFFRAVHLIAKMEPERGSRVS